MPRPSRTLALTLVAALGSANTPVRAVEPADTTVTLSLEDQANDLWSSLPSDPDDSSVTRLGHTPKSCAADALRAAKAAASSGQGARVALRTLALTVPVPRAAVGPKAPPLRDLFAAYAAAANADEFASRVGTSVPAADLRTLHQRLDTSRSDQALQPFPDRGCGLGAIYYEIRSVPDAPGRLYLHMAAQGGCGCRGPASAASELRRWRVIGQARLEPGDASGKTTLRWKVGAPRYLVMASCASCDEKEETKASAPAAGTCGACAPLADSATGWAQEARRAETEASSLRATLTVLEERFARQPKASAQGGRTLRDEVAAARGTVKEAADRLAELQKTAADLQSAGGRCETQCSTVRDEPSRVKKAGGGGKTALLIGGGAAVVAAGAAAAAGGGGSGSGGAGAGPSSTAVAATTTTTTSTTTTTTTTTTLPGVANIAGSWVGTSPDGLIRDGSTGCHLEDDLYLELQQTGAVVEGIARFVSRFDSCFHVGPGTERTLGVNGNVDGNRVVLVLQTGVGGGGTSTTRLRGSAGGQRMSGSASPTLSGGTFTAQGSFQVSRP